MKRLLALAFTAIMAMSFTVSAFAATPEEIAGIYGGDFKIAVKDTSLDLNPKTASDDASLAIINVLYDSLGRLDPVTLKVIPWVAESWSVDTETDEVTIMLNPNAVWHDGTAVTGGDVEYTYETFYGSHSVSVTSPTEVVFSFASGGGGRFMTEGLQMPLVKTGDANPTEGCGPYELISATSSSVTVGAYEDYFEGRPYLDTLEFIVYTGINTAANDLINGTIDFIGWTLGANDPTDIRYNNQTILGQSHLEVATNPGLEFLYIGYNPIDELDSKDLRVAFAMLVNKDLYANVEPNTYIAHSPMSKFNPLWSNVSVKKYNAGYFQDITGRQATNYYPGLHEIESLGYFDRDNDGWREQPDGSPMTMTMLGHGLDVDLRKNTIIVNYEGLLRDIGVNIALDFTGNPSDFDVYLDVGKLGLEPSAIGSIPMLAGYDIPALDAALTAADDALDMATKQMYIRQALGIISEEVPFVPLLSYNAVEASNRERWDGAVDMVGGRFNFWSAISIHRRMAGSLTLSVSAASPSIMSGENTTVTVRVFDQSGVSVEGVNVELPDDGTFVPASGTTDSLGTFESTYTAPAVSGVADVKIEATAWLEGYQGTMGSAYVTVHPITDTLDVTVGRATARIESGGSTTISVTIMDEAGEYVGDCDIYMVLDHAGGTLGTPTEVSDGQWQASFTGHVTTETQFKVTVTAVKDGYESGTGFTNVVVKAWGGVEPEAKIESIPDVGILAIVSITLLAVLVIAFRRRER